MRARSTLTRTSWLATSASRAIPIPPRTSPCWLPTAWTRPPRWWTSAPGRAGSRWPPPAGQVTAVDVSPPDAGVLRQRAAAAGVANLECVQAGFLSYQHAGPSADAVYTRNALHQLPDIVTADFSGSVYGAYTCRKR